MTKFGIAEWKLVKIIDQYSVCAILVDFSSIVICQY